MLVPYYFSPGSEILINISTERLFLYAVFFALGFIIIGEMVGLFEIENQTSLFNKFFLGLLTSSFACTILLLEVWLIEYDFVGRIAILQIGIWVGFLTFLFLAILESLSKHRRLRVLVFAHDGFEAKVKSYLGLQNEKIFWIKAKPKINLEELVEFCNTQRVDVLLLDKSESQTEQIDIFALIESGVRVLGVTPFVEMQSQKIPPREVDRVWLAKLDLRLRDPLIIRIKRITDILIGVIGLILSFPLILAAGFFIVIESGFPLFFHQSRTGFLGRPYVLHKLRTMEKNAEKKGAVWAQKNDLRVTKVGYFLRKWRIDEIPQFWNVIKGEMSIVGPRPERPELEKEIHERLPFWKCRYLLKPGLTGWAQIRFEYASDMESSEEKLAYDLFYLKNASFFLDLEIMLSTLRSLTRGSR